MDLGPRTSDLGLYSCKLSNYNILGLLIGSQQALSLQPGSVLGDLAERYEYRPYGRRTVFRSSGIHDPGCHAPVYDTRRSEIYGFSGISIPLNPFGHQGLMHEEELSSAGGGLVQNRHRVLHTELGRFLQRDPLGYVDGSDLYRYLRANPITLTDSEGTMPYVENRNNSYHNRSLQHWMEFNGRGSFRVQATSSQRNAMSTDVTIDWRVKDTEMRGKCEKAHFIQILLSESLSFSLPPVVLNDGPKIDGPVTRVRHIYMQHIYYQNQKPYSKGGRAELGDDPGLGSIQIPFSNYIYQNFETCIMCSKGCEAGMIYGCVNFGHHINNHGNNIFSGQRWASHGSGYEWVSGGPPGPIVWNGTGTSALLDWGSGFGPSGAFDSLIR